MSGHLSKRPGRSMRLVALLPVVSLAALGCASIIGLDDYRVAGGGAGGGGHAGSGHAGSGHAGDDGFGEAGEGGTTGMAGSAGSGMAGSDESAGEAGAGNPQTPVGCDGKTPLEPNNAVITSCLMRAGCNPNFHNLSRSVSTCVSYNTQAALPGESCNLGSTSCADYEACEHVGIAHEDLCGGSKKTRCDHGVAINCGNYDGDDRFFDCNALGGTCATYPYGTDQVLYADCKVDIGTDTCATPDDYTKLYCHSEPGKPDLQYYCLNNQAYGSSCSSLATCVDEGDTSPGNAQCFFNLQTCTAPATPTCKGETATICSDGSLFQYKCGSVGLSCSTEAEVDYCLAPGCTTDDVNGCTESCSDDGSELTFCYGGAPYTVKCADYGFNQCLTETNENTGASYAACRF